jgi:hypothetical protein
MVQIPNTTVLGRGGLREDFLKLIAEVVSGAEVWQRVCGCVTSKGRRLR